LAHNGVERLGLILGQGSIRKSSGNSKKQMENEPEYIEQLLLFDTDVFYYPEGYMYAKHILISFDSADSGAAAIAYVNGNIAEYNRVVGEAMPKIQERVDMIMQELNGGADFDDLMVEYSDDSSLNEEPYLTRGFLVGPYSTSFDLPEYLAALKTLEAEGEYTEPVTTYVGVYIIGCEEMLAGPVPYEEVKDRYKGKIIKQRKEYAWAALGQDWIDKAAAEGTLKQYPDRLQIPIKK
jgi:parvulin-like peptidyl-prolyl isomerase